MTALDRSSPTLPRQIRAHFDDTTITLYQAYSAAIAEPAVAAQKLTAAPSFKPTRMTWVKPSWAWMLYRAGYSFKDAGQERILALKMRHADFLALLLRGVLASQATTAEGEVRVQWDPERTVRLGKLPHRSIQIGIPRGLSRQWADEWVVEIEDVTDRARKLKELLDTKPGVSNAELIEMGLIPEERAFQVPEDVIRRLGIDETPTVKPEDRA
ncbi:hypothetical protein BN1723_007111, partial [Verticillium longisporum]|uniref:ATP-dependent RNA helicase DHX8 n=1 Tax=Verticillium longisporum TaxID=100787 RepID=A0A0G4L9J4_VERLO